MEYEKVGDSESEKAIKNSPNMKTKPRNTPDVPEVPRLEVPASVQDIIYRIQRAQVTRARDDIQTQMDDIMSNVDRIMSRYNLSFGPPSIKSIFLKEHMRKQRTMFLESVATYTKNAEAREKTLAYILAWLEEWNDILSDITTFDIDEHYHWIVQMEMFPDTLRAIENNVNILCSMSSTFLKDKKTQKKKTVSRGALWKTWKDRYIKRPATAYALRPDQMIADQYTTNTKVLEIQNMLQELIGSAMFTKLENTAIKYISSTILNLSKALSAASEQLNVSNIVNDSAFFQKYETERELSRRIIYDLSEQNEKLQRQLQEREEQYEIIQLKGVRDQQYESSSTATTNVKADHTRGSVDSILAKEFDNTLYKSLSKKIKDSDTKLLLKAPTEEKSELTQEQFPQSEGKTERASWPYEYDPGGKTSRQRVDAYLFDRTGYYQIERREHTKSPYVQERPGSNVGEEGGEKTLTEAKTNQYYELGEAENEREGIKPKTSSEPESQYYPFSETKSQDAKSGTPYEAQQVRKFKTESRLEKGRILPDLKEPPIESASKQTRGQADPSSKAEVKQSPMPQKAEVQGKTQDTPLTMSKSKIWRREPKESPAFSKRPKSPQLEKSRPNTQEESLEPERALATPEVKGEQSNTESFQKALMDFLKEKINNMNKPADENTMPRKESLLKRAEMENFETIKAKMDEYFQKMAEIVTQMVRKFKVAKKEGVDGEKPRLSKKSDPFMPAPQDERPSTTAESEISTFLSNENIDPVMKNVIETILAEMESEGDAPTVSTVRKEHKKAKPKQEKYGQGGQETMQRERGERLSLDLKAERHHQQKARGKKEDKQKPREGAERLDRQGEIAAGHEKTKGKTPEDKTKGAAQEPQLPQGRTFHEASGLPPETTHSLPSTPPPSPQGLLPGALHIYPQPFTEHKIITPQLILTAREAQPLGSAPIPQWTQALGRIQTLQQDQAREATLTLQQAQALGTILFPQQAQALGTILTPQQAQALGAMLTLQQVQALRTTLTPQQAQALGTTLTLQQGQDMGITLTPQQIQALGTILTSQQAQILGETQIPQEAQAPETILSPQQAQALGATLTLQQVQALGITLTPQQIQALGTILTSQQAQILGETQIPQEAQAPGTTVTPEEVQALGATLTLQQVQALGVTLTPQQVQALRTTLTPQQAQALGTTLTPQQGQDMGTTLTPQQIQALGVTLTPQQIQALGTILTSQQAQILGETLAPQEAQAPGTTVTPEEAQALGTTLTLQQAQALGTTLTPQQAQALGTMLTFQQAQVLGATLTPDEMQALGEILTPQQAQNLGTILTSQQAQVLGATLTFEQVQTLGTTLTPEQVQALGTTLTPEQAQALGTILTSQQAQILRETLTPQEYQVLETILTPEEDQALGTALIPQKAQALGTILTSQEDQALGTTLTPEEDQTLGTTTTPQEDQSPQEAQALGITLTYQEDQALGITLPPQESQALGTSLTPQEDQAPETTQIPQEPQALGKTLTPQQVQALGRALTPEEDQTLEMILIPQQVQDMGTALAPEQVQDMGTALTPEQAQAFVTTLIPQEAQALGTITPTKTQFLGTTLTPQQVQALGTALTPEQVQDMGTALTPEQAQAFVTTLIPQEAQALGTITPTKTQFLGTTLTPQQIQGLGLALISKHAETQAQALHPPLTVRPTLTLRAPIAPRDTLAVKAAGTSEQIQAMQISPHMQQTRLFRVPSTQEHAKLTQAIGATPAPEPVQAMEFPFTSMQAQPSRVSAIPELFPVSDTPPTTGPLLELEARSSGQLFLSKDPLTARPSPVLEGTPTPRWPVTSGMTSVPAKIPSVWGPLTPGKSFPEELRESRPLSIAGKPLEHQHAPREQSPSLPAPSTLGQQLTPLILRTLQKPGKPLPALTPRLLITPQKPQQDQKSRFPPIEKPWMVTSRSDTDKAKMVGSLPEFERKTYFVDVSAQRKNLILLNEAVRTSGLPSNVHMIARNLITETLHTDAVRLGHLLHKYVAYRLIQRVRNNIIHQIKVTQNTGKGYETQKLYIILSKIDDHQKKVMCAWTEKQKFLEETRNQCLKKMIPLFSQLRDTYKLNLSQPVPLITHKNEIPASVEFAHQTYQKLPIEEEKHSVKKIRHQEQMDAIWRTDLSTSSYPIIEKTPTNVPWHQLGGYPDTPRLLQLDVQSTFRKSLASIKMRIKKTPK